MGQSLGARKDEVKILFFAFVMAGMVVPFAMGEENKQEEGLFSEGSFFSEAFSSVSDKVNKVASGEEKIVSKDAKGIDKDILEYDGDPFRRPMPPMPKGKGNLDNKLEDKGETKSEGKAEEEI